MFGLPVGSGEIEIVGIHPDAFRSKIKMLKTIKAADVLELLVACDSVS